MHDLINIYARGEDETRHRDGSNVGSLQYPRGRFPWGGGPAVLSAAFLARPRKQ